MDGFSYFNIFETKGIEYLIIISFFAILIPFWIILNKQSRRRRLAAKVTGALKSGDIRIPQGVFFSKNHTWAHLEKSGIARIGLDDLLVHVVGDVSLLNLVKPGDSIRKGDPVAQIFHDDKNLTILSPVSGQIVRNNSQLSGRPEILNDDPFRQGWINQIRPSDWMDETRGFYLAEAATDWIAGELKRFKDFLVGSAGKYSSESSLVALQDGGELREQILAEMPDELWQDFQKQFLSTLD